MMPATRALPLARAQISQTSLKLSLLYLMTTKRCLPAASAPMTAAMIIAKTI